jgi:RNA polymerase sigma-B factor
MRRKPRRKLESAAKLPKRRTSLAPALDADRRSAHNWGVDGVISAGAVALRKCSACGGRSYSPFEPGIAEQPCECGGRFVRVALIPNRRSGHDRRASLAHAWTPEARRGRDRRRRVLSRDERIRAADDRALFMRLRRTGNTADRDELIARFMRLAERVAHRYVRPGDPIDDLLQVARLALVKAVDRFDPARGVAFSSYAVPTITGELKRFLRDTSWALHVPRALQEQAIRVEQATDRLWRRLQRSPSIAELAAELDVSTEKVLEALEGHAARRATSLDAPRAGADDEEASLADTIGAEDAGFELSEERASVAPALRSLRSRERRILYLRFVDDLTQSEIAERVGVSQMQVSRLIRNALEELRQRADGHARS